MTNAYLDPNVILQRDGRDQKGIKKPRTLSLVAVAAYRPGERLEDAKLEEFFNYSRKRTKQKRE